MFRLSDSQYIFMLWCLKILRIDDKIRYWLLGVHSTTFYVHPPGSSRAMTLTHENFAKWDYCPHFPGGKIIAQGKWLTHSHTVVAVHGTAMPVLLIAEQHAHHGSMRKLKMTSESSAKQNISFIIIAWDDKGRVQYCHQTTHILCKTRRV
jgi:hypothetical protein